MFVSEVVGVVVELDIIYVFFSFCLFMRKGVIWSLFLFREGIKGEKKEEERKEDNMKSDH